MLLALMLSSLVLAQDGLAQDGLAQDGLAQEEGPLAIPAQPGQPSTHAPAPPPAPRSDRPGAMSPQKLEALRRYQSERLSIQNETEFHGGGATVWTGMWWGPRWGPHTTIAIAPEPVFASRTWGFYQGPERLAVPTALRLAGDPKAEALQATIDRKRRAGRNWTALAGAGAAVGIAGIVGQLNADSRQEYASWQLVSLGGGLGVITGLVVSAGPKGEAQALERYPSRSLSPAEARAVADRHNDRLRQDLGLTPDEVWSIEQAPVPVR